MEMHSSTSLREVHGIDARAAAGRRRTGLAAALVNAVRSFMADLERRRRMEKDLVELQRMDDRMLADIGIRRGEIENVVRHGRRR